MNNLLKELFKKRKINSVEELDESEKKDFDRWERILSKKELNLGDVKNFCQSQLKNIESQWKNLDNGAVKNERLIIAHTIYKTLSDLIESPLEERVALENYLRQLLETKNV